MKYHFSNKQIEFIIGISKDIDPNGDLTDDEYFKLDEIISDRLATHGFDEHNNPTKDGLMCESILDILAEDE